MTWEPVTVEIELYEVKMSVTGRYTRGSAAEVGHSDPLRCSPEELGEFEIEIVCIGGVDVTSLMDHVEVVELPLFSLITEYALEAAEEAGL
jgi:hypothetical protein